MATIAFDTQYYLSQNPDVAAAISRGQIASAEQHYNDFGRFEGRDPNAFFDTSFYLSEYPDVTAAGVNPFQHFLAYGAAEGRAFNSNIEGAIDTNDNGILTDDFNEAAYLTANPDVAAAVQSGALKSGLQHFLLFGEFEGRAALLDNGTTVTGPFATGGVGGGNNPGQTLALTTSIDNIVAGAQNDTIAGTITNSAQTTTFQAGDIINGGGGTDTLAIVANGTNGSPVVPVMTNVENIVVNSFAFTPEINLVNSQGVQNVSLVNSTGSVQFSSVGNFVNAAVTGSNGGSLEIDYQTGVTAGLSDVQKISLTNAGTTSNVDVVVNGVETFQVTAVGGNDVDLFGSNDLTTITVGGAGSLNVGNTLSVTTFDASANTGGISAAFANNVDVKATGGAGDDTFNFGTGLTTADVVNGGTGTDTVFISSDGAGGGDFTGSSAIAPINALTSIERLGVYGFNGVTLNGSTFTNTGITNIQFGTFGADIVNNANGTQSYEFDTNNSGNATFALTSGTTSLKLALLGTDPTAAANDGTSADVGNVTITTAGVNATTTPVTVSLTSAGDLAEGTTYAGGNYNNVGLVTVAAGSTVNVDGSGNLAIFGGNAGAVTAGFANNVILNTSALTGNTVLAGSDFVGTKGVVGTTAQAVTNSGVDAFTLGAGKDIVVFHAAGASGVIETTTPTNAASTVATGNILHDTVNNFTAGANGDVLFRGADLANAVTADDYTALSGASQTTINALSGANATLLNAANEAANSHTAAGWTAFSFQGQTYALYEATPADTAFNNTDTLVQLTGVNVANLTSANFAV